MNTYDDVRRKLVLLWAPERADGESPYCEVPISSEPKTSQRVRDYEG
ncbi:MAG: hypothetical protein AAE986_07030 [Thermoplasmataceae archaeon]|nr:hypothetical protein [Candidatus Thermoplasmatota archaeon]